MPYSVEGKLVVAISSRALFDFEEENRVYEEGDLRAYEALQRERLNVPAKPGVAFVDAGNIFKAPGDLKLNALTGSIGFGVRLSTPFALLRADYGRTVWPGSVRGSGRWVFGVGQAF